MSFLGIGPLELLVVLVIALLVVGPNDLVAFARRMGKWLRRLRQSEAWQGVVRASWELQHWEERLWRETGLYDIRLRRPEEFTWHPKAPWYTRLPENPPSHRLESPPAETQPPATPSASPPSSPEDDASVPPAGRRS